MDCAAALGAATIGAVFGCVTLACAVGGARVCATVDALGRAFGADPDESGEVVLEGIAEIGLDDAVEDILEDAVEGVV